VTAPLQRKLAFVSGKGGVGKTVLAANFALCASTRFRTVLVDFDFQNQGSTGLLAQYSKPGCVNSYDLLVAGKLDVERITMVRERLAFVPAFDPALVDRYGSQLISEFSHLSAGKVDKLLDDLLAQGGFDLVVLDCHGGLDDVSFSSFIASDTTFIVTEADKVTFNGTLELLDFYLSRAATLSTDAAAHQGERLSSRIAKIENNQVSFLINRVTGKFDYESLTKILAHQLYVNFEVLRKMNQGYSFFPAEPLVAESFSEYPFFVELLPESIFSQKIELLFAQAVGERPALAGRGWLYDLAERMSERRLQRYTKSPYDERVQAVFSFVAVSEVTFSLAVCVIAALVAFPGIVDYFMKPGWSETYYLFLLFALIFVLMLYIGNFNLQISKSFRDTLRYEMRLYQRGVRKQTLTFAIRIVRLFLYRTFTLLWSALFFAAAAAMAIAPFS
jgi:MinD-like ATPase involved in chromosome partitioning or flagellar assembly